MDFIDGRTHNRSMTTKRILMIVTSHDRLGETDTPTGFWLEELAAPYQAFAAAGAEITIASPAGGAAPVDPKSQSSKNEAVKAFMSDAQATAKLKNTVRLDAVDETFDAYFVVGGHGAMWDLADAPRVNEVLGGAFERGAVVAAVCHGSAALVGVKADGKPLVAGRRVAGFSDEEEKAAELENIVPFPLESRLVELGGRYERGPNWAPFAVRDGRLVTGQNPASSALAAKLTLEALG